MVKVIFFSLHIGDLLGAVTDMDATEFGAHMSLLIAHYQAGEDGLPNDEKKLARMARTTPKIWKRIRERVLQHYRIQLNPSGGTNSRLVNDRCLREIQKIEEKSAQNSANAMKRHGPGRANANRPHSERNTSHYP